ncbi:hypothetical protein [Natrinema sp. DC36]|uniref:hypothetical protein n=1 Tax=Natrinema sp. DC36 TaxID=2878680 RepID=UPI001CF0591E|nr:hypothetical protein [Natrinema sp. DC36]
MASVETVVSLVGILATLSIAAATYWTVRKDIRTRLRIRHTNDIRRQVLEPWIENLPSYRASSPIGSDGGSESVIANLTGNGFKLYPDKISEALKKHFLEHHLDEEAPTDLDELLEEMMENVEEIRSEKRAYQEEVIESEKMEEMLSEVSKDWAEVDQQQLAIWLREVLVAEYTGGHFQEEILWWSPETIENGLKVVERDGEYHYYTLTEKKRDRHQVTNAPIITTQNRVPEIQVEKLLHEYKKYAEFDFGLQAYNNHIVNAGEAFNELISEQYQQLEDTLEYYAAMPVLPNDCYYSK